MAGIKFVHHAKGASAVLSRRFKKEGLEVALIQEPWSNKRKILGVLTQNSKLFYDEQQDSPRTAECIIHWIDTVLAQREITSELGSSSITVRATKGCPQGGVLSPLMWSLVVDDLLRSLKEKGFEVVGFADDIVIIVRGNYDETVSERMQRALNYTHSWCIKEGLSINPSKVVIVPFTRRRKINLNPFPPSDLFIDQMPRTPSDLFIDQ